MNKRVIILISILILLVAAYFLFFRQSDDVVLTSEEFSGDGSAGGVLVENQEFLNRLQRLQAIEMDTSVFSDPRFVSLVNFRLELVDEPTGRSNPFLPVAQ